MPRTTFAEENRSVTSTQFPKLKLEKDERARIVCVEKDPLFEYVHTLRAPKIVNGIAETELIERRDGTKFEAFKLDFIGRPLCLGDMGILQERGVDPKNCPVCEVAAQNDTVSAPERRFAMHIIKYATRPGSFDVALPFTPTLLLWAFTDTIYNKLIDFAKEWGNLQQHDLLLGPCTNPTYQKFDIGVAAKAEWLLDDQRKNLTAVTFKENKLNDAQLSEFIGRKVDTKWLKDDLDKIRQRWQMANGMAATPGGATAAQTSPQDPAAVAAEQAALTVGLDDLLSQQTGAAVPVTPPPAEAAVSMEDLLGETSRPEPVAEPVVAASPQPTIEAPSNGSSVAATEVAAPPVAQPESDPLLAVTAVPEPVPAGPNPAPGSSGEVVSFDDLLGS